MSAQLYNLDELRIGKGVALITHGICCAACGEVCEEKVISLTLPRSTTGMAVFRNVPAEVCPRCGETRFSLATTSRMMSMVNSDHPPCEFAHIPIYDLERHQAACIPND